MNNKNEIQEDIIKRYGDYTKGKLAVVIKQVNLMLNYMEHSDELDHSDPSVGQSIERYSIQIQTLHQLYLNK